MELLSRKGSTADVYRLEHGVVCKAPRRFTTYTAERRAWNDNAFAVERQLLERLGRHPRIVEYHGLCTTAGPLENGLLLSEANQGDLQSYIDGPSEIDTATRVKWCIQVAEAMAYVHDKGIVHSSLSMQNVLVHQRTPGQPPDILLADFGGSKCTELGVNGHLLPDDPFMDHTLPRDGPFDSPNIDVYSLGMLFYVIDTGHLPFHEGPAPEGRDWWAYEDRLRELSAEGIFPDLEGVRFRRVIEGCCCERRFGNGKEVLKALRRDPGAVGVGGDGVVEVG